MHYLAGQKLSGAGVTAVCSRDPVKLAGDWRSIRGNFGPPGQVMDLSAVKKYASLDQLLADPDIDLIDICNPTAQHPDTAIRALRAGKHVLVEKAIALTTTDADAMVAEAKKANRLLMVAHVLPFFPEFAFAYQAVTGGQYGKLLGGHLTRVIAKPDWSAAIGDADATGGPAVDLHIHDTHFLGLIAGVPKAVSSTGVVHGTSVDYLTTNYLYGDGGPALSCSSGAVATKSRQFVHGFELYLENATLAYNSGGTPLTVFHADGTSEQPTLGDGDPIAAFTTEIQTAVDAVKSGEMPALLSGQLARDALVLCHKECESVKTGKVVAV
ncbi:MAG: Gfo/Idh/MocA family oxidoreductase [Fimbriiglobus sp.]|nr:Gfo/Idh/MocA family oxidoreductase [Fimbriiglobus sp.]